MQDYFNVEWANKDGEKQSAQIVYNTVLNVYLTHIERIGGKILSVVCTKE